MRTSMVLVCLFSSSAALADGTDGAPAPVAAATMPVAAPAPAGDGISLRNGFSFSASQAFGSGPSSGLSESLFGGDWRIGARIANDWAVYMSTHLSFGSAKFAGQSGVTGNFAAALIGERSLPMRTFVGAGGGYGVLNNPSGPLAQLRAGWYPMAASNDGKSRRLNVALDTRFYFAGDAIGTVSQVALTVGYDRF